MNRFRKYYMGIFTIAIIFYLISSQGIWAVKSGPVIDSAIPTLQKHIRWQKWTKKAFEQAKRENKMILLNVGIEVCYACNWMEKDTYSVPVIVDLIMKNFVPIQVDANARPDLGERYSDWAWPATIFMNPQGKQVLALRGSRRPKNFIPILRKLISQKAKGKLKADALTPYAAPEKPDTTKLTILRDKVRRQLDTDYDIKSPGWGDELKEINGYGRMQHLFYRAFVSPDKLAKQRVLAIAKAMLGRMDKVWGGFFPAGEEGWKSPITEKRTGALATAMMTFAAAYRVSGDKKFLKGGAEVHRYLRDWMTSKRGTFYTSQRGEVDNAPKNLTPLDYFKLNDTQRRRIGIPAIDYTVYTDLNARVIKAYVDLYEASGEKKYLLIAKRATNAILTTRLHRQGWLTQIKSSNKIKQSKRIHLLNISARPLLRTQMHFGIALLSLQRATGDEKWLKIAIKIAGATTKLLQDPNHGGFYATTLAKNNKHDIQRKPLQDNGVAARFYYLLGRYTKVAAYEKIAERAVRASVSPTILNREGRVIGDFAVALETLTGKYVEFSIVGNPKNPVAKKLYQAARTYYDPRKIVHFEKPGRYPKLGRPAMYICNPKACSIPIFKAANVHQQARKFAP